VICISTAEQRCIAPSDDGAEPFIGNGAVTRLGTQQSGNVTSRSSTAVTVGGGGLAVKLTNSTR
jgi:hypothetical protein